MDINEKSISNVLANKTFLLDWFFGIFDQFCWSQNILKVHRHFSALAFDKRFN
jgi:hypothetical protein